MAFTVERSDKQTGDIRIIISTILETLGELDASVEFIHYKEIPKRTLLTLIIKEEKVMIVLLKLPLTFLL